jgi:hypothetical protein
MKAVPYSGRERIQSRACQHSAFICRCNLARLPPSTCYFVSILFVSPLHFSVTRSGMGTVWPLRLCKSSAVVQPLLQYRRANRWANHNHWGLVLLKGPNTVGVSVSSPENGDSYDFWIQWLRLGPSKRPQHSRWFPPLTWKRRQLRFLNTVIEVRSF